MDRPAGPQPGADLDERFEDFRFLIRDRDSNFTASFDAVFQAAGTTILRTAVQAPRMNAIAERWIASARCECLDRMLITRERHLRLVLSEYVDHYNTHRHRALKQAAPLRQLPGNVTDLDRIRVQRRDRVGGVIHEYRLVVA